MLKSLKMKCRREALGMTTKEFAEIAKVTEEMIENIEAGNMKKVSVDTLRKVDSETYEYLRSMPKKDYYVTELIEEALYLKYEDESEHMKTLTHIALHANKMNMSYVGEYRL